MRKKTKKTRTFLSCMNAAFYTCKTRIGRLVLFCHINRRVNVKSDPNFSKFSISQYHIAIFMLESVLPRSKYKVTFALHRLQMRQCLSRFHANAAHICITPPLNPCPLTIAVMCVILS